jgi:hypothetical protein
MPSDLEAVSNFEDYWTPFLGGKAPAPGYCMSLSEDAHAAFPRADSRRAAN